MSMSLVEPIVYNAFVAPPSLSLSNESNPSTQSAGLSEESTTSHNDTSMQQQQMCDCQVEARQLESSRPNSRGRRFLTCRNRKCGYFKWIDYERPLSNEEPSLLYPSSIVASVEPTLASAKEPYPVDSVIGVSLVPCNCSINKSRLYQYPDGKQFYDCAKCHFHKYHGYKRFR